MPPTTDNLPAAILTQQEVYDAAADFLDAWAAWFHRRWNMSLEGGETAQGWDNAMTMASGLLRKGVPPTDWPRETPPPPHLDPGAREFWEERNARLDGEFSGTCDGS